MMSRFKRPGKFQFCIELGLGSNQTAFAQHQSLTKLAQSLLEAFDRHRIPVTLAVNSAMFGFVAERSISRRHEVSLLADHTWLPETPSRAILLRELERQAQDAADLGVLFHSLVARDVELGSLGEAVYGAGFRLLRTSAAFATGTPITRRSGAAVTRQAILCISPSAAFPGCGRLLGARDAGFAAKKSLLRAITSGSTEHLSVSGSGMLRHPSLMLKSLSRVIEYAARLRDAGRLSVETVGEAGLRSCPTSNTKPSHSILRPAA